jgi:hypothetical protein
MARVGRLWASSTRALIADCAVMGVRVSDFFMVLR